ncbi:NCK-interacting protein with SH3 domain-like isoform X3 [Stylophora pistillata]|uniref:NCK-interacting protein with SH3 domain-like isoform X3 n=1 Tax=Stylophora pistillata TaxID=50429 RepID=UPI000C05414A|nr:NCK-interacting protein with SH3 domain-like isoform X3 [Stylophora pistillata]
MEERQSLGQKLIEIFACICGLEKEILCPLLCSVMATELEIQIMNRKVEDPTALFQYPRSSPDAVLKFVTDIFSSQDTSEFFYTSDMKILIEIVLRQLTDLSPGTGVGYRSSFFFL